MEKEVCDGESAMDLYIRLGAQFLLLKSGDHVIDLVFHNGIVKGEITELVGESAVGKTQFCLTLIANFLLESQNEDSFIVYISTDGNFRSERLLQILELRKKDDSDVLHLLSKVFVTNAFDEESLLSALQAIKNYDKKITVLFVDSIGLALSETALNYLNGGKKIQCEVISILRSIALQFECAVITTNYLVLWKNSPAPSLGDNWVNAVDSRYLFARIPGRFYVQRMNSKRHRITYDKAIFTISDKGVQSIDSNDISTISQTFDTIFTQNWENAMQIFAQCSQET